MKAWITAAVLLVGLGAGVAISTVARIGDARVVTVQRTVTVMTTRTIAAESSPACPKLTYAVDGTAGPIFCKIDNPAAMHYYRQWLLPLMKLGADATPTQVTSLVESWRNSTNPITCAVYDLAQHALGWQFAINPVSGVTGFNC
jgi:hypothetical protein